jgi:hypothetical protein
LEQLSRRDFFSRKVLGQVWQKAATIFPVSPEPVEVRPEVAPDTVDTFSGEDERKVMPEYFSSPLYSYALLSEMPWDMLIEEAKRLGIDYEGRSKIDVVREIFMGKGGTEGN